MESLLKFTGSNTTFLTKNIHKNITTVPLRCNVALTRKFLLSKMFARLSKSASKQYQQVDLREMMSTEYSETSHNPFQVQQ